MRVLILSVSVLLLVATNASAKPLDFVKLSWAMDATEMVQAVKKRGYECSPKELFSTKWTECKKEGGGTISIYPGDEEVTFSCQVFNGCKKTYKEMAEAISSKYQIPLEYDAQKMGNLRFDRHCGSGPDGDRICITQSPNKKSFSVTLSKGSLGETVDF